MQYPSDQWALVLGGSSGLGLATADKLSRQGLGVAVVHRDRRGAMGRIQPVFDAMAERGHGFQAFNLDALSPEGRGRVVQTLREGLGAKRLRVLVHSIAFGNLKRFAPEPAGTTPRVDTMVECFTGATPSVEDAETKSARAEQYLEDDDWAHTIHAMGTSLASWVRDALRAELFAEDARVIALTSEGRRYHWPGYGAVSAAKAALEAVCRTLAYECAPLGLRTNVIQAGITSTPAVDKIPNHEQLLAIHQARNPFGRLTRPEDVANAVWLLCTDEASWINGAVLAVDGGERLGV